MSTSIKENENRDRHEIDTIVSQFFDLFTNTNGRIPKLDNIKTIFIANGLIINNSQDTPDIYTLESFITPRAALLTNGSLINFQEQEVHHKTEIYGTIAHRTSSYIKSGELHGKPYKGKGIKLMQFVKVKGQWWLSSVIWTDAH